MPQTKPRAGVARHDNNVPYKERSSNCYNCGEEGHYADKCPQPKKKEYVRAAYTAVMEESDDGDSAKNESDIGSLHSAYTRSECSIGGRSSARSNSRQGSVASTSRGTDRASMAYQEIEVPAADFYDDVDPDVDFMTSLHAFPLEELEKLDAP